MKNFPSVVVVDFLGAHFDFCFNKDKKRFHLNFIICAPRVSHLSLFLYRNANFKATITIKKHTTYKYFFLK